MDRVGKLLKTWAQQRNEDDFVDRLHYKLTALLLTSCAFMIFAKEYGGNPIRCWGQAQWPGGWVEYAHDICFVENTFYVSRSRPFAEQAAPGRRQEVKYYQVSDQSDRELEGNLMMVSIEHKLHITNKIPDNLKL